MTKTTPKLVKTVLKKEEYYIQFTPEELEVLGIKKGDKFTWGLGEEGEVTLKKHIPVEVDLGEFSRETLELLVKRSVEEDVPVGDIMTEALRSAVLREDGEEDKTCSPS